MPYLTGEKIRNNSEPLMFGLDVSITVSKSRSGGGAGVRASSWCAEVFIHRKSACRSAELVGSSLNASDIRSDPLFDPDAVYLYSAPDGRTAQLKTPCFIWTPDPTSMRT